MKKVILTVLTVMPLVAVSAPLGDFTFKSPAFNGIGYSSHVLTIENQERTRQKEREDKLQSAIDKASADAKNTNLSKFLSNLESRIYAQISQNVATAMFANNSCSVSSGSTCNGSINFQGNTISWTRVNDAFNCTGSANGTCIQLTVSDPTGTRTDIYVPLESFQMPGN
jgi:Type VIII secretion system (T8SS), CsgF protein